MVGSRLLKICHFVGIWTLVNQDLYKRKISRIIQITIRFINAQF
jgi:hypothetical protein